MESSNPTLNNEIFAKARATVGSGQTMTIQGTVNKTFILFGVLLLAASWAWLNVANSQILWFAIKVLPWIGFGMAFATTFKPKWSPITAPIYAAIQGVCLGAISALLETRYPGIAIQAVGLTMACLFVMLVSYQTGWIQATEGFRKGIMIATAAIFLFYLVVGIAGFFHVAPPGFITGGGIIGIGFSLFVVGIATLNLILNFDTIERCSQEGLEKYMEWYGAFSVMVTLVWLYMEILNLLAKLRGRN